MSLSDVSSGVQSFDERMRTDPMSDDTLKMVVHSATVAIVLLPGICA